MNVGVLGEREDEETDLMKRGGRVSRGRGTREEETEATNREERTEKHCSPKPVFRDRDSTVIPLHLVVLLVCPKTRPKAYEASDDQTGKREDRKKRSASRSSENSDANEPEVRKSSDSFTPPMVSSKSQRDDGEEEKGDSPSHRDPASKHKDYWLSDQNLDGSRRRLFQ